MSRSYIPGLPSTSAPVASTSTAEDPQDIRNIIKNRLAKLRLENARHEFNSQSNNATHSRIKGSLKDSNWRIFSEAHILLDTLEASEEARMLNRRVPGPKVPKSWSEEIIKKRLAGVGVINEEERSEGSKVLERRRLMGKEREGFTESLVEITLKKLLYFMDDESLPSEYKKEWIIWLRDNLGLHLVELLLDLASDFTPLNNDFFQDFFLDTTLVIGEQGTGEDCNWDIESPSVNYTDHEKLSTLNLAFASITTSTLTKLLYTLPPTSNTCTTFTLRFNRLTCLNLTGCQSLHFGQLPLLVLLSHLPLTHLYLASMTVNHSSMDTLRFFKRLAGATYRLKLIDLSFNGSWLSLSILYALNWSTEWNHLSTLIFRGYRDPILSPPSRQDNQDFSYYHSNLPSAVVGGGNRHGTLIRSTKSLDEGVKLEILRGDAEWVTSEFRKSLNRAGRRDWLDLIV